MVEESRELKGPARKGVGDDSKRGRDKPVLRKMSKRTVIIKLSGKIQGSNWPMSLLFQLLFILLLVRGSESQVPFSILKHSMFISTPRQCPFHNRTRVVAPPKLLHHPADVKVGHHRQRERDELQNHFEARVRQRADLCPPSLGAEILRPALSCGAESRLS